MVTNPPSPPLPPADITDAVDELFCSPDTAKYGPYRRLDAGAELLADRLYRYSMLTTADQQAALQVYRGLNDLGGQLWEQEARVLLRVTARGHPALPRLIDGGYDDARNLGFAVTEFSDVTLTTGGMMEELRHRKADAIRFVSRLADALSLLHGQGVLHRNLWPGTIAAVSASPGSIDQLRLERFEMSGLITNVLRRQHRDPAGADEEVRRFLLSQGAGALAYFPIERITLLDPIAASSPSARETDRSDVYGLGVLCWEIFVGPLPAATLAEPDAGAVAWVKRLNEFMRSELQRASLPKPLSTLIADMLDPDWRTRITSAQVVDRVAKNFDSLISPWEAGSTDRPHLVLFMPAESGPTVYEWRWITHAPTNPEGKVALREFLEDELRGAALVYSAEGARQYVPPGRGSDNRQAATAVLLGKRGAWFCQPFQERSSPRVRDEALLIKYVAKREKVWALDTRTSARRISSVDARPWDIGSTALAAEYRDRPSWRPLLDTVRPTTQATSWQQAFASAIDWLLDLQLVELRAREYPYRAETSGEIATLRYDAERDRTRMDKHRDPVRREPSMLFSLYSSNPALRPGFAEYFAQVSDEDDNGRLEFFPDENGQPNYSLGVAGWFREDLDDTTIRVIRKPGEHYRIPAAGWVRLAGDRGNVESHKRQLEARDELAESLGLIDQFENPTVVRGHRHRWREAGKDLAGGSATVVRDVLSSQPFFAIHGPPGTGKSTVTAEAVCAYLAGERAARLLVSAQSNFALDNLAVKIRKTLEQRGQQVLAVRIASRETESKVDERLTDWLLAESVTRLIRELARGCERRLHEREYPDPVKAVLGEWRTYIPDSGPELYDRLRRGASLVFATCAGATRAKVDAVGSFGVYDWVIVEEAAKAWPTELALPLVRGTRWTLVGDYKQLPAYRRQEVQELLAACAASPEQNLNRHGERQDEYLKVFDLFKTLFNSQPGKAPRPAVGHLDRPLARLTTQYRMRKAIGDVVSEAFYADVGGLATAPSAEVACSLTAPEWLAGKALVWLDTAGTGCGCRKSGKGSWVNDGEAQIVADLIGAFDPPAGELAEEGEEAVTVLTPYRAQVDAVAGLLPNGLRGRVFTPHEYQGREANVVLCSLVRDTKLGPSERRNYGHLVQPELVNVMFSRARQVLVIVGNFEFYRDSGLGFWRAACDAVRRHGEVRPARSPG